MEWNDGSSFQAIFGARILTLFTYFLAGQNEFSEKSGAAKWIVMKNI